MRLISARGDGSFALTEFATGAAYVPPYAILSHRWGAEEVTYDEVSCGCGALKAGYDKLRFCIKQAAKDGLQYCWIDTCCIDKSNSSELNEAINSMFSYYSNATRCYVYLSDVSATTDNVHHLSFTKDWERQFRNSEWFTRGWTLQELIAPRSVEFFSEEGTKLGDKRSLLPRIRNTTGIPEDALLNEPVNDFSIPERLSWASGRRTTRIEDSAYSLLGIFGVYMPTAYGEGDKAFARLLRELQDKSIRDRHLLRDQDQLIHALPKSSSAAFDAAGNGSHLFCATNTRLELLHDISTWAEDSHNRKLYWVSGKAGSGKSTFARTVARTLRKQGILGGSFFFSSGNDDANRADYLFTTLASQLAYNIPQTKRHIYDALAARVDIQEYAIDEQWKDIIIEPLSKLKTHKTPIVLLIDGLDECVEENQISTIVKLLASSQELLKPCLKAFVTSRRHRHVALGFERLSEANFQSFGLDDIARSLVDRDLSLYITERLAPMDSEYSLKTSWPSLAEIVALVDRADGLFLWATLACRVILEGGKQFAQTRSRELLQSWPSSLDNVYAIILKRVKLLAEEASGDQRRASEKRKTLLGVLTVLARPLSIRSLAILLDSEPPAIADALSDLYTLVEVPSTYDRPIEWVHRTARDYLTDRTRCSEADFWVNEQDAHMALADSCLQLLSKVLPADISDQSAPGAPDAEAVRSRLKQRLSPELQYASLYWVMHLHQGKAQIRNDDAAVHFLRTQRLHWIEAIGLSQSPSHVENILRTCCSLFPQHCPTSFGLSMDLLSRDPVGAQATQENQYRKGRLALRKNDTDTSPPSSSWGVPHDGPEAGGLAQLVVASNLEHAHDDNNTNVRDLGSIVELETDALSNSYETVDSSPIAPFDPVLEELAVQPNISSACEPLPLPLRDHEDQAFISHPSNGEGATSGSNAGRDRTHSAVNIVASSTGSNAADPADITGDIDQEGNGNDERTPGRTNMRDTEPRAQIVLMPCPCVSAEDGFCQGTEPNVSTMRRKVRTYHQLWDCERCWDQFDSKALYDSHDCLRCEPCCISGACESSGEDLSRRKHPRDKWKCPSGPTKLEAVEYWHYARYGIGPNVPFVLCERNTQHSVSRLPRLRRDAPAEIKPHHAAPKRSSEEASESGPSTKKQAMSDSIAQAMVGGQEITIQALLDHIDNLPCRVEHALRRHINLGSIPERALEMACQIPASTQLMIKQSLSGVFQQRSRDEVRDEAPRSKGEAQVSGTDVDDRSMIRPEQTPRALYTGSSTPAKMSSTASSFRQQAYHGQTRQQIHMTGQFMHPSLAQAEAGNFAQVLSDGNFEHQPSQGAGFTCALDSSMFDFNAPEHGNMLNDGWENVPAVNDRALQ